MADLRRTVTALFGEQGEAWLRDLPRRVAEREALWSIRTSPPFTGLSYSFVAPGKAADGTVIVLKLAPPGIAVRHEIAALRHFAGRGAVRLLADDADAGALLLERAVPGDPLSTLWEEEAAMSAAAAVMRKVWRPAPPVHDFPSVSDWGRGFERLRRAFGGGVGPFPVGLVDRAERLFGELAASMAEPVVLHGDLHHANILSSEREPWLAIDPKGVIGEPAYEVGAVLRNPMPVLLADPDLAARQRRRIDVLAAELGFDRERIAGWAFAQAVLAARWAFEDDGAGWEGWLACAVGLADAMGWRR